jgi:hypothetical protein
MGRGSSRALTKAGFGPKQESGPARLLIVLCEREPRISRGACSRSEAGAQLLGCQAKRGALTAGALVSV